jgi:hypothetical protein
MTLFMHNGFHLSQNLHFFSNYFWKKLSGFTTRAFSNSVLNLDALFDFLVVCSLTKPILF